jgi:hypothetical protein
MLDTCHWFCWVVDLDPSHGFCWIVNLEIEMEWQRCNIFLGVV